MENATKALMIAGAVLLVILIIAVGMAIFNAGNDTINQGISSVSNQKVQMFNEQFVGYEGSNISGSQVKSLLTTVLQANTQLINEGIRTNNDTDDGDRTIKTTITNVPNLTANSIFKQTDISNARAKIVSGAKYTVTIASYSTEGYVNQISISQNGTNRT